MSIGALAGAAMVSVVWQLPLPPVPVKVPVKTISPDVVGKTVREPLAPTAPMPWSIEPEEAFVLDQESVVELPKSIVEGETVREHVGTGVVLPAVPGWVVTTVCCGTPSDWQPDRMVVSEELIVVSVVCSPDWSSYAPVIADASGKPESDALVKLITTFDSPARLLELTLCAWF